MIEIQLSQMSVAKLITRFRLQAYLGATIIDYGNQGVLGIVTYQCFERG